MRRTVRLPIALVVAVVCLAAPAVAADPVTVGSTSTAGTLQCSGGNTSLYVQDALAPGSPSYAAPEGVITSWRVGIVNTGTLQLKVVREGPDNSYTVLATSAPHAFSTPGEVSVPDRVVVPSGGGSLALFVSPQVGTNPDCMFTTVAGDTARYVGGLFPEPQVGEVVVTTQSSPGRRVDVAATVEADADHDGYGDVTQDLCPTSADTQGVCVAADTTAPDTTAGAKRKVFTSKHRAKVKVSFAASEPGATFVCTVDDKRRPCQAGTLTVKLRLGKHRITVAAVDASGNADPTPAGVTVKVKHKRRS